MGRDISRYNYNFSNRWLINTHNNPPVDVNHYSAIKNYLNQFDSRLKKRSDKGKTIYNLRNCAYLEDFEKQKILWLELTDNSKFTLDTKGYYLDMTVFFMTGKNLKYLLALLNSKLIYWYFNLICAESGVGTNRWKKIYVEQLPIKEIEKQQQKPFEILVDYIMLLKTLDKDINEYVSNEHIVKSFEEVLDAMVYELYFKEEFESKLIQFEKEKGHIKFIEYAKEDYASIEGLDEVQAIEVMQQSYKTLKEPYNKIRNNLILVDIEFPDLIRPIKESL